MRSEKFAGATLLLIMVVSAFISCGGGGKTHDGSSSGDTIPLKYAEHLTMVRHPGYITAEVRNPWDTLRQLQKYILLEKGAEVPENTEGATVVRIPLDNALVYSTVHVGLISELGSAGAVGGVCNASYVKTPEVKDGLREGRVADCGNSMSPDIEKIIRLNPDGVLLSPYENNDGYARVGRLDVPVIECADYMESSALGRAEWVKFYGLLFGAEDVAERMFSYTDSVYSSLRDIASTSAERPKVILDQRYGQTWYVPTGHSTVGRIIEDAGGTNPFASLGGNGSVPLSPEKVLAEAHDADVWLVRYNQNDEKTLRELGEDAPVNSRFKAYRDGNVYGCNTLYTGYFEETPFHPDRLLADFISALHPELAGEHRYFKKMH